MPTVSEPADRLESEAATAARRIVADQPVAGVTSTRGGPAGRGDAPDDTVLGTLQRLDSGTGATTADGDVAAVLRSPGKGAPVPADLRERIEPRLGASLASMQVHTGPRAEAAASAVNARAFTYGGDVFLNRGESPHDLGLMAHEATHVVQQGAAGQVLRTADSAEEIQRLPDFITDRIAEYARHIPGYTLFTVLIGYNPITGRDVPRTAANLVQGLLELVPFGALIYDRLQELGVIEPAVAFIDEQLARYDLSLARVERLIDRAWDRMDFVRLDPFDYNVGVLVDTFTPLYDDVVAFAGSVVDAFVALIREAAAGVADELLSDNAAWALMKKILHWDPIRGERVEAETVEILADFLLLIGRETELEQMREKGTLQETADWIDTQLAAFQGLLESLTALVAAAWEAIQPRNLANLLTNLEALAVRVGDLIAGVWQFAITVAAKVLELVKDALLGLLSDFVHHVPGFHLVTVLIGRNPFTGEAVPRTAENLIKGFISLLPGGMVAYERLAETGVVGQAAGAIEAALTELGISWAMVRDLFLGVWEGLGIEDLVDPVGAFTRIRDRFGEPIARLFSFIGVVVREVFRLVLALMHFPTELLESVLTHALQAMEDILADPVGFLLNMLAAVKEGFSRFLANILDHMLGGLLDWLFRGLRDAGIEPPADLSLQSALDLVMQVLGITVDRLWEKLAERLGPERVEQIRAGMDRLTGIWEFVRDVSERGVAAVWGYLSDQLGDLWNLVIGQAAEWILTNIVQTVTAKLLSMLDPTGVMAVVNSFIAVFNAIESAIEYIRDMLEILNLYVTTMASIARGDIEAGAGMLEQGLAAAIPVALGFLANQVGLGRIGDKIAEIVGGIREVVDRALDWLLDQAERALQGILSALGYGAEQPVDAAAPATPTDEQLVVELSPEERAQLYDEVTASVTASARTLESRSESETFLQSVLEQFRSRGLRELSFVANDPQRPWRLEVHAHASPGRRVGTVLADQRLRVSDLGQLDTGRGTTALGWLNDNALGRFQAEGSEDDHTFHAEEWALAMLSRWMPRYGLRNQPNTLLLKITRSPCPACSSRLLRSISRWREAGYPLAIDIQVASVHRTHAHAGLAQFLFLNDLEDRGLTISPWDVLSELDDLGFDDDQVALIRERHQATLERRIHDVRAWLETVASVKAST